MKEKEDIFYGWDVGGWWLGFVLFFLGPIFFFLEKGPTKVSIWGGIAFLISVGLGWMCLLKYLDKKYYEKNENK